MSAIAKVRVGGVWVPTNLVTRTAFAGLPIDYLLNNQIFLELIPKSGDNYYTTTETYFMQQPAAVPATNFNPAINNGPVEASTAPETVTMSAVTTVVDNSYSFTLT